MFCRKIFIIIFLFCLISLSAGPVRFPEKFDPMDRFGLSAEYLSSSKTRAADSLNCTLVGGWFTGPGFAVCIVDTLAYIGAGQAMKILNVKDSTNPVLVGEVILPSVLIFDIFLKDTIAYVANYEDGLRVINVSDPSSPFEIGFLDIFDVAYGVWVKDTFAYVAGDRGLSIINVANPASMSESGNCDTPDRAFDVWIQDTLAYVADWGFSNGGLRIINVADPSLPVEIGLYDSLSFPAVYVRDTIAYTAVGTGLNIINVSEPSSPVKVGSYDLVDSDKYDVIDAWIKDTLAYLAVSSSFSGADSFRLEIVNIANPDSITEVGLYLIPGGAVAVQVKNNLAYVEYFGRDPDYLDGLIIIDISNPSNPFETGRYGMGGINEGIWIKDTLAYVTNHSRGLRIINIADPFSPREIGFYDTPGSAYAVYVQDTLAYVADWGSGLRIIDVANPYLPGEIGSWNVPSTYGTYGVWVQDTLAYVACGDSGLRIIDVSDPTLPIEIGFYYEATSGIWVMDSIAYLAGSGLNIISVSDPASPSEIGSSPGSFVNLHINDTLAFVTGSRLYIFDISDPSSPVEIGSCDTRGDPYGVWYKDNLVYVADSDSGLCIINALDPSNPTVVGFYKVYYELSAYDVCVKDSFIYVPYDRLGLYIFKYTGPYGGIEELTTERDRFNITSISNTIEINYSVVDNDENVKIEIFNILGQKVACPVDGVQTRGSYTLNWSGKTGIYFVRMEMGGRVYRQKTLLVR